MVRFVELQGVKYSEDEYLRMLDLIYDEALQETDEVESWQATLQENQKTAEKTKREFTQCKNSLKEIFGSLK